MLGQCTWQLGGSWKCPEMKELPKDVGSLDYGGPSDHISHLTLWFEPCVSHCEILCL